LKHHELNSINYNLQQLIHKTKKILRKIKIFLKKNFSFSKEWNFKDRSILGKNCRVREAFLIFELKFFIL